MKKYLSVVLCFILMTTVIFGAGSKVNAAIAEDVPPFPKAVIVSEHTQQVSDDTYVTDTIYEEPVYARASTYTKQGARVYTLRNSNGEALWQFTVQGTFSVTTGVSATCTNVTHSYEIYSTSWKNVSASSYRSGNSAYGNAEFNRKLLGITVETKGCSLVLSCDANGNLS